MAPPIARLGRPAIATTSCPPPPVPGGPQEPWGPSGIVREKTPGPPALQATRPGVTGGPGSCWPGTWEPLGPSVSARQKAPNPQAPGALRGPSGGSRGPRVALKGPQGPFRETSGGPRDPWAAAWAQGGGAGRPGPWGPPWGPFRIPGTRPGAPGPAVFRVALRLSQGPLGRGLGPRGRGGAPGASRGPFGIPGTRMPAGGPWGGPSARRGSLGRAEFYTFSMFLWKRWKRSAA